MHIIAAVKSEQELEEALKTDVKEIFDLCPSLMREKSRAEKAHIAGKKLFAHIDLAEGIGKDRIGIEFIKSIGLDGIISTRVNMIKFARESGLCTIQRFFIIDSHSVDTTVEALKSSKADMIEIMPGVLPKIIRSLREQISVPIIAGGLVETNDEAAAALNSGAFAVSTSNYTLWNRK